MIDVSQLLTDRLAQAFTDLVGEPTDPALRRSDPARYQADYQADGALALAKKLRRAPRDIATDVVARADLGDLVEATEISGPGFVNLTVSAAALGRAAAAMAADERLGVRLHEDSQRVLVDYSGPNVAKEMHVGHLRSTIIGDALVRLLEHLGHEVVRRNHLGDWGTPFGMLIEHMVDVGVDTATQTLSMGDLNGFYQDARRSFDGDPDFADRARRRVVLLQGGDEQTLALWRLLVEESARYFQTVYDRMDVRLVPEDIMGESAYNDLLAPVADELAELGLLRESDGAMCVFPEGFTGRDGGPLPLIVRKRDGGYNYATTDLAAIRRRITEEKADRLVYLTDLGQGLHFRMVFQTAREAGWLRPPTEAEFVGFGMVLGPDRKRLRTRSGDSVKLGDLLDEAVRRASAVVAEKAPDLPETEREAVAHAVGIGALKYADLSGDRTKDYVFDWDQMLSFDGNTAPYLQYAHARICSMFRRGEVDPAELAKRALPSVRVEHPAERALVLRLTEFDGVLHRAADGVELHRVCGYLFDLAQAFTTFYEHCPVLRAEGAETRTSRLVLADLTRRVLAQGLSVLGIQAPSRM